MGLLNWFTGPKVRTAGFVLTALGSIELHPVARIFYLISLAIALIATYTKLFNWLKNFADPNFWPAFVGLGVCICLGAYSGGWFGLLACVGPLTTYDGMYFEQNY